MNNPYAREIAGIPLPADLDSVKPRAMVVQLQARPGCADDLRRVVVDLVREVRREPGCVAFIPYQHHADASLLTLYEVYDDLEAFKAHLRTDHVQRFITEAAKYSTSVGGEVLVQLDEILVSDGAATDVH